MLVTPALALIGAGVGLYVFAHRNSAAPSGSGDDVATGPITTIADLLNDPSVGRGRLQFVDPRNPGRIARELEYERLDPLPQGRFAIAQPRAWVYFNDGRVLYVRAAKGKIKKPPKSNEVESGDFDGGVVARLFAPPALRAAPASGPGAGSHPINPETDTPILVAYTDSLSFDRITGEFATSDRINISTPDWEAQGVGLHAVFNDVKQRPGPSAILRGEYIVFKNGAKAGTPALAADGTVESPQAAQPGVPTEPALGAPGVPVISPSTAPEDFYHVDFRDSVEFIRRGQSIRSDTLDVWARFVDGRLAPGALGKEDDGPQGKRADGGDAQAPRGAVAAPTKAGAAPGDSPARADAEQTEAKAGATTTSVRASVLSMRHAIADAPAPLLDIDESDSLLLWTGALTLTPLETPPAQLARDEVALKFGAILPEGVRLADLARGSSGHCTALEYRATSRALALDRGVWLEDPSAGSLRAERFEQNLATGDTHIPGAGLITDKTGARQVAWTEQADLRFDVGQPRNKREDPIGFGALREAMFTGEVHTSDEKSMAGAEFVHVWFGLAGAKNSAPLERVVLDGRAHAQKRGKDPREVDRLRGERFDVAFALNDNGRDSHPSVLTATGAVEASRTELVTPPRSAQADGTPVEPALRTSTLTTDMLEAEIQIDPTDAKGKRTEVSTATAQGHVRYDSTDGLSARADLLRADALRKIVDLTGEQVVLASGAARITGTQARLDGERDALDIFGPGRFDREATAGENAVFLGLASTLDPDAAPREDKAGTARVTWAKSMHFDNQSGLVECKGQASATSVSEDGLTLDKAQGERFVLHLAPRSQRSAAGPGPLGAPNNLGIDGRILLAEAFGVPTKDSAPEARATVESRRYTAPMDSGAERKLERLLFVEGLTIAADQRAHLFSVPTPGRALVVDRTQKPGEERTAAQRPGDPHPAVFPDNSSQGRGHSLFTWTGSMSMDNVAGRLEMHDGVRLVHKPLGDGEPMTLDANDLTAFFRTSEPGPTDRQRLVRALARGDVTAETEGGIMRLLAQDLDYDAVNRAIDAAAPEGERATLFDQRKATPLVARRMHWDMVKDKVTVTEPAPMTVPLNKK